MRVFILLILSVVVVSQIHLPNLPKLGDLNRVLDQWQSYRNNPSSNQDINKYINDWCDTASKIKINFDFPRKDLLQSLLDWCNDQKNKPSLPPPQPSQLPSPTKPLPPMPSDVPESSLSSSSSSSEDYESEEGHSRQKNCHRGEEWRVCATCEPTCENPSPMCASYCQEPACQCIQGFVRMNGKCLPMGQCPKPSSPTCGENESWKECSTCEATCETLNQACTAVCGPPQCQCNDGFVRKDNKCVNKDQCDVNSNPPAICGKNEEWKTCATCEKTCTEPNPICTDECRPGLCQCKDGYVRFSNKQCVSIATCPPLDVQTIASSRTYTFNLKLNGDILSMDGEKLRSQLSSVTKSQVTYDSLNIERSSMTFSIHTSTRNEERDALIRLRDGCPSIESVDCEVLSKSIHIEGSAAAAPSSTPSKIPIIIIVICVICCMFVSTALLVYISYRLYQRRKILKQQQIPPITGIPLETIESPEFADIRSPPINLHSVKEEKVASDIL